MSVVVEWMHLVEGHLSGLVIGGVKMELLGMFVVIFSWAQAAA